MIYHITFREDWEKAIASGAYVTESLHKEGFIHCSESAQVAGVLDRYYAGKKGLVKLTIDPAKLSSRLIHEWSPSTLDTFPHIYGPINLDAVVEVEQLN